MDRPKQVLSCPIEARAPGRAFCPPPIRSEQFPQLPGASVNADVPCSSRSPVSNDNQLASKRRVGRVRGLPKQLLRNSLASVEEQPQWLNSISSKQLIRGDLERAR